TTGGVRGPAASGSTEPALAMDLPECAGAAAASAAALGSGFDSGFVSGFLSGLDSGAGLEAAAAAGAALSALASPCSSISATTLPSDNESPTLTRSSFTTPANGAGTSSVALSDSSVSRP